MRVTKNPLYKRKVTVDAVNLVLTVAGIHFARLLYVLQDEGFGKKKLCEYWDKYVESVNYVSGDRDTAIKRYRMNELLKDVPYITYSRAMNVLDCQAGFAPNELEIVYRDADARSDLIDNIMMSMLTLHYDFGFGERRIARVMTAWAKCNLDDAIAWAEKRTGNTIEASKKDVYDWLEATTPRKQRTTLQEQKAAKQGLEAFRRWTADNTEGVV